MRSLRFAIAQIYDRLDPRESVAWVGSLALEYPCSQNLHLVIFRNGEETLMPHTIVTNVCEGVADCVDACPVACIHDGPGKNEKGTDWYWIDFATCIDCGICLQVCPVEGAIVPEERPELQKTP